MRRRDFITLLGGTATWPLAANAQQPAKIPHIGVLWHAANAEQEGTNYKAIVKGFADIGYIDGKTVVLEHRFPNEQPAQFRSMAAELVASGVDVLVVIGANAPPYAKEATKTIPIVFALMPDPIGSKLVNNLARPEANVTGLSNSASDIVGKRLALFKEVIPGLSRVALLVNSNSSLAAGYEQAFQAAAANLGLSGKVFTWRAPDELISIFAAMKDAGIQAVMFNPDGWAFTYRDLIAKLALAKGLPLSDVAGMIRSFDLAAWTSLSRFMGIDAQALERLATPTRTWASRSRRTSWPTSTSPPAPPASRRGRCASRRGCSTTSTPRSTTWA